MEVHLYIILWKTLKLFGTKKTALKKRLSKN